MFGILKPNIEKVWHKILNLFFIQSYKFNMSCVDDAGHFLHSDQLKFSTRHLSSLRSTKINENNNPNRDSSSHNQHSGHHSSFISKSDYLTEMNLKLLPAISNSIQQQSSSNTANTVIGSDDPIKVSTSSLSRSYYTKKTSPHAVLGNFKLIRLLTKYRTVHCQFHEKTCARFFSSNQGVHFVLVKILLHKENFTSCCTN